MKKPNLFIIGAPKCGTTSMSYYLSQHPQIFFSKVKEPHYFNTDSNHRFYFDLKSYLSLFKDAKQSDKYIGEGSVWYLYSSEAVDNILNFNPDAKFLVMLRNPVNLFFSLHQELLFGGNENLHSPLDAWMAQEERSKGKKIPIGCSDEKFLQYKKSCSLGNQLETLLNKIDKENLFIITIDELKINPDYFYIELLKFLGVDEIGLSNYDIMNKRKVRRSYMLSTLFHSITKFKRKLGVKKGIGIANTINKFNVKSGVDLNYKDQKKELIPILFNFFRDDILLLEKLTNKNLNHWKK
jgi:hypothetical protein